MKVGKPSPPTVSTLALSDATPAVLETKAIHAARRVVRAYASAWYDEVADLGGAIAAVRGDYGSGKTFLLLDAVRTLHSELPPGFTPTILSAACIGGTPLSWYRQSIGPDLKRGSALRELMIELYASAARDVAAKVNMTLSAVDKLDTDPRSVLRIINENKLNRTAVDEVLGVLLEKRIGVTNENLLACFRGFVWGETETLAARWLNAEPLNASELDALKVSSALDSNGLAADAIAAVARLHTEYRRPFAIFIDELEHFVLYDARHHDGESNITWLKRLLEVLAPTQSLVFVAGHWDAWDALKADSLDRFSPGASIEMLRLRERDIVQLVRLVEPSRASLDPTAVSMIARVTGGNMRQVLRLIYELKRTASEGSSFDPSAVERAAEHLKQKLTVDQATTQIEQMLQRRGIDVERESLVANVPFTIVGAVGGRPRVVVELRDEVAIVGDVSRFVKQLQVAQSAAPGLIGIFVSDAGIGSEISDALASSGTNGLAFDLAKRDFMEALEKELDVRLGVRSGSGAVHALEELSAQSAVLLDRISDDVDSSGSSTTISQHVTAPESRSITADEAAEARKLAEALQHQLEVIELRRAQEAEELRHRVDALSSELRSDRDREVARLVRPVDEPRQTLHVTYSDVARPTNVTKLLTRAIGLNLLGFIGLASTAIAMPAITFLTYNFYGGRIDSYLVAFIGYALLLVLTLALAAYVVRRFQLFQSFDDRRIGALREIYVRTESPELLIEADNQMRQALSFYGPLKANRELGEMVHSLLDRYRYREGPPDRWD